MGRLTNLKPQLARLRSGNVYVPEGKHEYDRHRANLPWRQWYNTKRWRRLRWSILMRDMLTCQMCYRVEPNTSRLVADHKVPHRGDEHLFWDDGNLWALCKPCHDSAKQREERLLA
jgi:5-methylcytosine-specific restriction protein A